MGEYFSSSPEYRLVWKWKKLTGGPAGALLGVNDIEKSIDFYGAILGYDTVVYDKVGKFDDLKNLPGGDVEVRRVLLQHSKPRAGAFSKLLGSSSIELVQVKGKTQEKFSKADGGETVDLFT